MNNAHSRPPRLSDPARVRLNALSPLDDAAYHALDCVATHARKIPPRCEVEISNGLGGRLLLLDGWAARTRHLKDGRRQIISILLPGDIVEQRGRAHPATQIMILALSELTLCAAPEPSVSPALAAAYSISRAMDEELLFDQVTRLGRMTGQERVEDLLCELLERLELAGMAQDSRFAIPITQETLADATGLTPVHVNRMLQSARKAGVLTWREGMIELKDCPAIRHRIGRVSYTWAK